MPIQIAKKSVFTLRDLVDTGRQVVLEWKSGVVDVFLKHKNP